MNSESDSDRRAAAEMWKHKPSESLRLALLTTVSPDGAPHATWMGTARNESEKNVILTITSPDSDKVRNIRAQPQVEWMITSSDRKELLYLEGNAELVESVPEIKKYWNAMPGKEKAFFLRYYNSGIGFSIIRTKVVSAVYVVPEESRKSRFAVEDLQTS